MKTFATNLTRFVLALRPDAEVTKEEIAFTTISVFLLITFTLLLAATLL